MKLKIYEQDNQWGWSIFDEYGDEISASTSEWPTREECRKEAYAALSDWEVLE
jgi:hypothetical protein